MQFRFNADEWVRLTTSERIHRCHLMQDEALKLAQQASPELKRDYVALAEQWARLAKDLTNSTHIPSSEHPQPP
jgi:hypothetical protein